MSKQRVLIVYHHQLFGEGLQRLLGKHPGVEVVGVTRLGPEVPEVIESLRPDVLLVDHPPGQRGCEILCAAWSSASRVIHVALDANSMRIVDRRELEMPTMEDLVAAVMDVMPETAKGGMGQ